MESLFESEKYVRLVVVFYFSWVFGQLSEWEKKSLILLMPWFS